jgi:CHAT domain-containing protein
MKKYLLLAFIFFSLLSAAQTYRRQQVVVQAAENIKPGQWRLTLQKPEGLTLPDSLGFVVGSLQSSLYRNYNLSAVRVIEISDQTIVATASTFDELKQGDIVFFKATLAPNIYQGKLYHAAMNGIYFKTSDGQPYYSWSQVAQGNKAWEDQVLNKMLTDIKKGAASFNQSVQAGSSQGKKVTDIMNLASLATVQSFLMAAERVPQVFSGSHNFLNEFGRWVQNGSTDYSAVDLFFPVLGKPQEFENLKKSKALGITRDFLLNLANGANVRYSQGNTLDTYLNTLQVLAKLSPGLLTGDDLGYIQFSYGSALDIGENYKESFQQFTLAAQAYQGINTVQYARSISRQAESLKRLGEFQQAGELFLEATKLWRQQISQDPSLYNFSRLRIALEGVTTCTSELEQYQENVAAHQQLIPVYRKLALTYDRGSSYWSIGYAYGSKLAEPALSNQSYERAYQIFDTLKRVSNAVTVLCNQAINFRVSKNFKAALEMGQRAEAYAKANLNSEAEGYALNNIMETYKQQAKVETATEAEIKVSRERALEAARKMEKLYASIGLTEKLATAKDEIASLLESLDKRDEAARVSEEALKLYQQFATGEKLADAYWNAGYYIGAKSGRVEESNAFYRQAFEYYKDASSKNATTLLSNIGVNYRQVDEETKSYTAHTEAVQYAIAKKDTTSIIFGLEKLYSSTVHFKSYTDLGDIGIAIGRVYHSLGKDDKAIEWANKVIDQMDKAIEASKDNKVKATLVKSKVYEFLGEHQKSAEMMYLAGDYTTNWPDGIRYYKSSASKFLVLQDTVQLLNSYQNLIKGYTFLKYADSVKIQEAIYKPLLKTLSVKRMADHFNKLSRDQVVEVMTSLPVSTQDKILQEFEKNEKVGELADRLATMERTAKIMVSLKRYRDAIEKYKVQGTIMPQKSEAFMFEGSWYGFADNYWDIGYALSMIPEEYKVSNDYYLKAAAIYKKEKGWGSYEALMNNIAVNFRDMSDSVGTYKTHREALANMKPPRAGSKEEYYCKALENLGKSYKHFGHHHQAMKVRLQAAQAYELVGNKEKAYSLYYDAGQSADEAKRYKEAEQSYRKGLALAEALNDTGKKGSIYFRIAYNIGTYQQKSSDAIPIWGNAYQYYLEAGDTANASIAQSNIGQEYWTILDFDKAIENHYKAIDIATKGKYTKQVASSWRKLADLYKETKNPTKQSEAMNKAINMLEVLKDTTELMSAYFDIGSSYSDSQETEKADGFYNRALQLAVVKKDSINIGSAYAKLGDLYFTKKQDLAITHYEKAIVIQKKIKDKSSLIYSLASEGSLLSESNRPQSEKLLNEALTLAKELKDNHIIAFCHTRLYSLFREIGKPDVAHEHMETAIQLYKGNKNKVGLVNNYVSYANEYLYDYGDFVKAQAYMTKAKVLLDSITNPLSLASFYSQQSTLFADQGIHDEALAELDKAQVIYEDLKNEWGLAGLYISYGNIYKTLSEYALSLKYQSMSDSLYRKLNVPYQCLAPIANIGGVYFSQGDYPKALDYFKRSLKLIEDNKDLNNNLCKLLSSVGEAYSYMTNYDEAEKWLMKALETSRKIGATRTETDIMINLGKLKIETKKYSEAEKFLLDAKTFYLAQNLMVERTSNAIFLGELFLKKGELEKAKMELTDGIELAEKFGKNSALWEAYFRMGEYYRLSKNLQEAKNYLLKSVHVIENLRSKIVGGEEAQKLFSSDKWILEAYEELISVLLELGETEEAMAWLQKINENNVRDKMRSMDVTFEDEEKNKTLAREKEMKLKLDAIEKQIAAQKQSKNINAEQIKQLESVRNIAEGDYLKFVNQTVNVQPELSKYFSNTVQPSQLKGKKKQIPKDMALVSYLVGEKQLYIFVATSDTVVARIVSVTKEKIHRDVNAMTNITKTHLGNFGSIDLKNQEAERREVVKEVKQTDQMLKPFEEAYSYLISPISELIVGKSRLGIIPTGELNYIPFQLLGKTLKNGKFSLLINQYAMFYTNSTDMLLRSVTGDKEIHILAFGNPDKTLPATEKEVKDIKKIFPNTTVWVQDEATEERAKYAPEEFNVMHFATHGNLDYEDFSQSYLTMAGSKGEDGKLTLEELWGMEVMSHLNIVVLSACQTAVTKGSDESSPVSPASGFLQNGVKSVVATLWKVDDEATSILMNDFYKHIQTMDAVDAMRIAQSNLASIPKFNHPYYWGAMVLIGDWR